MKRYIVLSVNENPDYLFYVPLTIWAWKFFEWEPVIFLRSDQKVLPKAEEYNVPEITKKVLSLVFDYIEDNKFRYPVRRSEYKIHRISRQDGYKSETIAQISRLYGACVLPADSYIMTGDIDMLPLSDYWKPDESKITVWGHDLTGYQHVPICYIGMPAQRWIEVMGITSDDYNAIIKRDLDEMPNAKSHDSVKRWVVDQDLITERINGCTFDKDFIYRGTYANGYAKGRVDRSAWTLNHEQLIDCHLMRNIYSNDDNFNKTMELLNKVWPTENFTWVKEYAKQFKSLL